MEKTEGETEEVTNYSFNSLNQLTQITKGNDGYQADYEYDVNGNRIRLSEPGYRETTYTYDYEDRLTSVYQFRSKTGEEDLSEDMTEEEIVEETAEALDESPVPAQLKEKGNANAKGIAVIAKKRATWEAASLP